MPPFSQSGSEQWYVYLACCSDATIYTGITNDLIKRLQSHNSARGGARYTRGRQPVTLVYYESHADRSQASRREAALKKLPRKDKQRLAKTFSYVSKTVPPPPGGQERY